MTALVLLLRLFGSSPAEANAIVAGADIRLRVFLDRTALRECRGLPCSIHDGDAHHSPAVWKAAVRAGYLDPKRCPAHRSRQGWSTRGAHGLMAGYAWRFVPEPLRCFGPEVLDVPLVSALTAAAKRRDACERGHCSHAELTSIWTNGRPPEETTP